MADLSDTIESVAGKTFEVESEEGRAKQHSLDSLVKAAQYLDRKKGQTATKSAGLFRMFRTQPPGAV